MVADNVPVGSRLRTEECGCEFTAQGHADASYPAHAIFKHTKPCKKITCRWRGTREIWKFGDEPINRPGDIVLELVGGTEGDQPMINCTHCPYIARGLLDLAAHLTAGHGFSPARAAAEARRMQEDRTSVFLPNQAEPDPAQLEETREEAIKARLAAATPGPWYDHNPDDDYCMNAYAVTDSHVEPDVSPDERTNDHKRIIAITLLQTPRVAAHDSHQWEENARFIAHAPADIAFLLAELEQTRSAHAATSRALELAMADVEKLRYALLNMTSLLDHEHAQAVFSLLSSAHPGREGESG